MVPARILGIFAHPDDESLACGALLAAAAERGARVALLCLTRGEAGPGSGWQDLGDVRSRELEEAARVLGAADVTVLDHADGMLPFIAPDALERDIAGAIRRLEPDVVVTFDLDGLYWHADHVAVHERVTAVVAGLGAAAPALWYVSIPEGVVPALSAAAARTPAAPLLGVQDAHAFGALAPPPTVIFTDARAAERKVAALRCHRSQTEGTALDLVDAGTAAVLLATEHYRRADVGAGGETLVDLLGVVAAIGATRG